MKDLGTIVKIMFREKRDIYLSVLCGFIAGITAVGLFASSGYLISKSAFAPPIYTLMILVASVKLLGIISAVSRYGERYFSHRGTFTMLSNLRSSFYEKIEPLVPRVFHQYRSGDLLARIVGDIETLQNFFLLVFYPPIVTALIFVCTIFIAMFFSMEAALIIFIGFILTTIIVPALFLLRQRKFQLKVRNSRSRFSIEITEFLYGYRDLKIYQQVEGKEHQLNLSSDAYLKEQEREEIHHLFGESVNTFLSLSISFIVLGTGAYLVSEGQLDGIFLAMLVMISLTVFENVTTIAALPGHLEDNKQAAARLNKVVSYEEVQESDVGKAKLIIQSAPSLEVENLTFTFPDQSRKALSNISLRLPAGSKTAIVGPSGSGKSTLMQLIMYLYPIADGEIRINDQPYRQLNKESIWKHTNIVLQENHFFFGTIRDNLLLDAKTADDDILQVLEKVKLGHFSLDDSVLEKGENLSGGEKQRLAIARIFLKKAPLWLLDEPTSSLDAITEAEIYQHLFSLAEKDTLVLISHRLQGLEEMDQIVVMDRGRIVEMGNYHELMEMRGYFYGMKQIEKSVFTWGVT
ncbi:thiol reductant ABC exporter subunit CydC [Oceanobacillus salinisoli]|uniref:thiol reductant ABC exporter subunit CydC n=1 Tax=Oceanobacillus salinisoli TaxID=2678611 RepID=UPI0012E2C590|nr:thiol reductant ABC exporter subunit CydC [Oceanobacillus salinisoli]